LFKLAQKSLLLSAIGVLEYGLSKSKFNYNIKLLLIRLYIEIGVSKRAFELSESLDIKQMQFDALGYLCVDDMHLFGNYQKCLEFIEASRYIYERNEIETPDMLAKAFEFKTFSKIPEFFEFKDKLANSIQNYSSFYQMISTKLFTLNTYDSIVDYLSSFQKDQFKLDFDRMIDNRDFGIIPTFVSSQETIPALIHGTKFPKDHVYLPYLEVLST
jgi:N-terminal acetyltransferase B complex non-catalytic subunit